MDGLKVRAWRRFFLVVCVTAPKRPVPPQRETMAATLWIKLNIGDVTGEGVRCIVLLEREWLRVLLSRRLVD